MTFGVISFLTCQLSVIKHYRALSCKRHRVAYKLDTVRVHVMCVSVPCACGAWLMFVLVHKQVQCLELSALELFLSIPRKKVTSPRYTYQKAALLYYRSYIFSGCAFFTWLGFGMRIHALLNGEQEDEMRTTICQIRH